ncbi:telomerase reverse transcriptase-like isoform X2 [Halichondria panicea]|uniref:telomerase reverse transcriptase-like isoform X2 n=1 Tax=Halichondria panicea TaxID=6063 RepID=UPI00312BC8D0
MLAVRLPRRLNTAISHFTKLLSNHRHKVPYHVLLNFYCPVSAECPGNHGDEDTTSVLRNLVSEHLSHDQVLGFLKSVLKRLVPLELWGSKYNRRMFYYHLRKFLQLRRRETLSVKQMCEGVKFAHCDWLKLHPPKHKGRPHPPQRRLFERLIHWLMTGVIIRTLKAFFYVTEHSEHQNCLFYYRKKVWSRIQELAVRIIPYQQIPLEEVQHHVHFGHTLGISKLRFLPKTKGVRPIVNFRSKINLSGHPQLLSINDQLRDVFHVLNYEKNTRPEIIASSCFGLHEVFVKLKRFSTEQKKVDTPTKEPLLFVRVDISSCYDSMVPKKALEIVSKDVLSQRSYLIRCFAKLFISRERVQRLFLRAATAKVNSPSFFKFAKQQAKNHSNCIFVDKSLCIEIKKEKVKSLLQKHLFGNLVKLGNDYYKQVQGIAHGAKLSTLLCGFYYADMEQNCVLPTVDPSKGLLMRYVDDFLLITREVGVAREFLTTMQRGVAEYNCTINPAKTVTNFKLGKDEEIEYLENVEWVKWCGLLLNTKTLDVMADFSIYTSKNIRDNMTIALHSKHFSYLRHFSRRIIRLKCMPVLLDAQVVTNKTAVVNIYQGFLIASYKYLTVLLSMPNGNKMAYPCKRGGFTRKDFLFFFKTAVKMFAYFWQLAQNRGVSNPFLNESVCVWLGCHAFKKVLIQHQPHKKLFLIHLLAQKLESLSNRLVRIHCAWPILLNMPRCACASEVYGSVCVCVCVYCYSCSRINEVQVRVSIGF